MTLPTWSRCRSGWEFNWCTTTRHRTGQATASAVTLYQNPLAVGRDAVRQPDAPTPLTLVDTQNDAGIARRMVNRSIKQQKARTKLGNWNRISIQVQRDTHIGRVAEVTVRLVIDE